MTGFTEAALSEKAEAILERNARIELTERDFERFVEAIAHPVPPTPELAAAMRNYDRQAASEPDGNW